MIVAGAAALAAGCSSSPRSGRVRPAATTAPGRAPSSTTTEPPVTPAQAAITLARALVRRAVLPPGATPADVPLPPELRGSFAVNGAHVVGAHSEWTIGEDPVAVIAFLAAHPPPGFVVAGRGESADTRRGLVSMSVQDRLRVLPENVGMAGIAIATERDPGTTAAVVVVVANVQWTPVRPAGEHVAARDRVVILSVVRQAPGSPVERRVVVTDPTEVAALARSFDALRVSVDATLNCPAEGPNPVSYRVAFATANGARPDLVATIGFCAPIVVFVDGRRVPDLGDDSGRFSHAVAHALGAPELTFADPLRL